MKLMMFLLLTTLAFSKGIDPEALIKSLHPHAQAIEKKSALLTSKQIRTIGQKAHTKPPSHLIRYYQIVDDGREILAIVIVQKVRTKKAAVMYFVNNGTIEHIEILAFGEPPEFRPTTSWLVQFDGKNSESELQVGEDIAANSGATLSAKNVANGARLALVLYEMIR